jgi:hypothetical protein
VISSNAGATGTFRFAADTLTWTWSDEVYAVYGFAPGDVVPTTELVLSHQHPDDRADVEQFFAEALEGGPPRAWWHRLVDAQGGTRQVVTVCAPTLAEGGGLLGVCGFVVDLTEAVRRATSHEVDEAMEAMAVTRPAIEQAKGALMLTYGLLDEDAFALLRSYSQQANVKVRDVARNVVEALPDRDLPVGSRATWDRLAADLPGTPPEQRDGLAEQPGA